MSYADIIVEATRCSSDDAAVIEELIRVTHPILSGLDRAELMREARIGEKQMQMLARDDPETLDFYRACAVGQGEKFIADLQAKDAEDD